ncbi:flagellar export chaperone FliS [Aquabacterium sp.]|jgi:flagellar protein FliS|uniref:flagellar export chaperone FliS n=1 Tax=Aquabacterium sp. TaxID=1872578 RepID=UPI0025BFA5E0|nr:flagellar export chaperone FliS [Aquabacterium sp.]
MSSLYKQVGVETSISGANPHQLIKLLLTGFFDAVAEARGAMNNKDTELKGKALSRALRIVDEGLKASLDLRAGGELAQNLNNLYSYVCLRLTHANLRNDQAALDECVALMQPVREAWEAISSNAPGTRMPSGMELHA